MFKSLLFYLNSQIVWNFSIIIFGSIDFSIVNNCLEINSKDSPILTLTTGLSTSSNYIAQTALALDVNALEKQFYSVKFFRVIIWNCELLPFLNLLESSKHLIYKVHLAHISSNAIIVQIRNCWYPNTCGPPSTTCCNSKVSVFPNTRIQYALSPKKLSSLL